MKIKSRLIALAVSAGIPVTLVAQSPNEIYRGEYLLKISVPGVPWAITASSTYEPDGTLKEIDYLPAGNFFGIEGQAGHGHWSRTASGQFLIDYKTELPNGQVRALTTVSASGNELTGTATVKLINQDGSVAETRKRYGDGRQGVQETSSETEHVTLHALRGPTGQVEILISVRDSGPGLDPQHLTSFRRVLYEETSGPQKGDGHERAQLRFNSQSTQDNPIAVVPKTIVERVTRNFQ